MIHQNIYKHSDTVIFRHKQIHTQKDGVKNIVVYDSPKYL